MNYLEKARAYIAQHGETAPTAAAPVAQVSVTPAPGAPPCERGQRCDLDGKQRYCGTFCKPAFERDAERPHPPPGWDVLPGGKARATVDTPSGSAEVVLTTDRPAWLAEIDGWPADYQEGWRELAESFQRAGHPRAAAEYLAHEDLAQGAREAAEQDRPPPEPPRGELERMARILGVPGAKVAAKVRRLVEDARAASEAGHDFTLGTDAWAFAVTYLKAGANPATHTKKEG